MSQSFSIIIRNLEPELEIGLRVVVNDRIASLFLLKLAKFLYFRTGVNSLIDNH